MAEGMKPMTFTFSRGAGSSSFTLSPEAIDKVRPVMEQLDRSSDAIRYLHDMGWSNAAICKVLVYPTNTEYHKAGDNLLPQHVATTISKYKQEKMIDPSTLPVKDPQLVMRLSRMGLSLRPLPMDDEGGMDAEDLDSLMEEEEDEEANKEDDGMVDLRGDKTEVDLTDVDADREEEENYKKASD